MTKKLEAGLKGEHEVMILGRCRGGLFSETAVERLREKVASGTGLVFTKLPEALRGELTSNPMKEDPAYLRQGTPYCALPGFKIGEDEGPTFRRVVRLYRHGEGRVVELNLPGGL